MKTRQKAILELQTAQYQRTDVMSQHGVEFSLGMAAVYMVEEYLEHRIGR